MIHLSAVNISLGIKKRSDEAAIIKVIIPTLTSLRPKVGLYLNKKMMKSIYNTLVIAPHAIDIFDKYLK